MQVKAIRDCFVGSYRKADEEFEYNGPKNKNLQPLGGSKWPPEKPAAKKELPTTANPDAEAVKNLTIETGKSAAEPAAEK